MKKTIIPAIIGGLLFLTNEAKAPPNFDGKVWRDVYGNPADSADVIITNKNGIDTVITRVGRAGILGYWGRAAPVEWNLQLGDTVKIKTIDIDGDSAKTWREVTSTTGNNRVIDLYPENDEINDALLIRKVWDTGIDSVDAKCWVKGKLDTLYGRFRINTDFYNISFNRANFPIVSRPQIGDSVFFRMTGGSYVANSKGIYMEKLDDGDTFPSCSLKLIGIKENLENKINPLFKLAPTITNGPLNILGMKLESGSIYNAAGEEIKKIYNVDKLDLREMNVPSGIYFVVDDKKRIEPEKIIYLK
ncbi:MAG: hypothetical protein K6T16_03140 [Candidatus Pacearchaeota archaeon]|nr:hypothetical protein [Candidatus Pacearchaeota archaeon]